MGKRYFDADDVKALKATKSDDMEITPDEWRMVILVVLVFAAAVVLAGLVWALRPGKTAVIEKRVYIQVTPADTAVSPYIIQITGRGDDLVVFTLSEDVGVSEFVGWNGSDWNEFKMDILDENLNRVRTVASCSYGCEDRRIVQSFSAGTYFLDVKAYGKWRFEIQRPTPGN